MPSGVRGVGESFPYSIVVIVKRYCNVTETNGNAMEISEALMKLFALLV